MSPANIAASVKARLQNKAKTAGKTYNDLLRLYAMERFLYRLSKSEYAEKFVLKGALLFMVWKSDYERRTTMDIDLLGFTENSLENLASIAKEVCETDVGEDGIRFDSENIRAARIKEDADYEGVRILTNAFLERSRIPIQIDIDIWNIIQHEEIDGKELQKACAATFNRRRTPFDLDTRFFSETFPDALGKETQWAAFVRKQGLEDTAPASFRTISQILLNFFRPMVEAQLSRQRFEANWSPSGQWQ